MIRSARRARVFGCTAGAAVILLAGTASAAGFATARFGGEHGHPTTTNPTAIYYNPAGLGFSEGVHLFLDGSLALRKASFERPGAASDTPEPAGATGANTGAANLFNVLVAPMAGASIRLGNLALGAGFYVPFGGSSVWDGNSDFQDNAAFPGAQDGVARWYNIEGSLRFLYGTLGAAYYIPVARLSIGASVSLVRAEIETVRARTPLGGNSVSNEGRSLFQVDGVKPAFGVGVMLEPIPDTLWLGASYQSAPTVVGEMTLEGTLTNNFARSVSETDIDFELGMPDIVRVGGRVRPVEKIELRLFGDYTRWSRLERMCLSPRGANCDIAPDGSPAAGSQAIQNLPREWDDSFAVRVGVSFFSSEAVELFGGVGYDSNAVPDGTLEPALLDAHDVSLTAGTRLRIIDSLHLALSYTHIHYFERNTVGESRLADFAQPSRGPDAGGTYKQWIGVLNANLEVSF